jgi:hypothetical protein
MTLWHNSSAFIIKNNSIRKQLLHLACNFVMKIAKLSPLPNYKIRTASVVWWSEFLATDPVVPGSIPDATRFSEK